MCHNVRDRFQEIVECHNGGIFILFKSNKIKMASLLEENASCQNSFPSICESLSVKVLKSTHI